MRLSRGLLLVLLGIGFSACAHRPAARPTRAAGSSPAPHRGFYEVVIDARGASLGNPFTQTEVQVVFTRPDGRTATTDAFFAPAADGRPAYRARAYCDTIGRWSWRSKSSRAELSGREGHFQVTTSSLPGKLRVHPNDPQQLAYDDGSWFLHLGDTAYRYATDTESAWQSYLDQAAQVGFNKIRVWFARSRHHVEALLTTDRSAINLPYWNEIERRLLYALDRYPHIVFQLIPYAEDAPELRRYGSGDAASHLIGRYAQARFSALPNVTWVLSNDQTITLPGKPPAGEWRDVDHATIVRIGRDFAAREPWGTLIANHQARKTGYAFVEEPWSNLIILQGLDEVDGTLVLGYRQRRQQPVVLDEDRYEQHRNPASPRYFFRRLFWATLLSGGHPTYGGNRMFEPGDGSPVRGIAGYYDLVRAGTLSHGAIDFAHIRKFFADSGLSTVGMRPDDELAGAQPQRFKCLRNDKAVIVYLANPSGNDPRTDVPGWERPSVELNVPEGTWSVQWFDPRRGAWHPGKSLSGGPAKLEAPRLHDYLSAEDWVLLLRRS